MLCNQPEKPHRRGDGFAFHSHHELCFSCYQELTPRLVLRDEKRAWAGPKGAVPLGVQPWSLLEETDLSF